MKVRVALLIGLPAFLCVARPAAAQHSSMYETIVARLHRVELALIGNEHTLAADAETHLMQSSEAFAADSDESPQILSSLMANELDYINAEPQRMAKLYKGRGGSRVRYIGGGRSGVSAYALGFGLYSSAYILRRGRHRRYSCSSGYRCSNNRLPTSTSSNPAVIIVAPKQNMNTDTIRTAIAAAVAIDNDGVAVVAEESNYPAGVATAVPSVAAGPGVVPAGLCPPSHPKLERHDNLAHGDVCRVSAKPATGYTDFECPGGCSRPQPLAAPWCVVDNVYACRAPHRSTLPEVGATERFIWAIFMRDKITSLTETGESNPWTFAERLAAIIDAKSNIPLASLGLHSPVVLESSERSSASEGFRRLSWLALVTAAIMLLSHYL